MSTVSTNILARTGVTPQREATLLAPAISSKAARSQDRFLGMSGPTFNKLICGGLALTAVAMLPTAGAQNICDVHALRLLGTCGAAALQAIACGAGGLLQCGGAVVASAACNASVRQACMDGCIDPRSLWCC